MLKYFVLQENTIIIPYSRFFTLVLSGVHPFGTAWGDYVYSTNFVCDSSNLNFKGREGDQIFQP